MDPSSTWVTRMRTILPPAALTANDLVLQASAAQASVSNQLTASVYDDPSYSPCSGSSASGNGSGGCNAVAEEPALGRWLVAGSLALVGSALVRRRRARK
jgi:MYXO-CTERM domain-containing protein